MPSDTRTRRFVAYYRVSTVEQGASGLGLEAQRRAVTDYLARIPEALLLHEAVEVESGKNNQRPKLKEAMDRAALTGATLVIAKLDRLSRNAHFLTGLAERGVKFTACDMPDANEFTVTIMAALAQQERVMIGDRTRLALKAAKARGTKLGSPLGGVYRQIGTDDAGKKTYERVEGNASAVSAIKAKADSKVAPLRALLADIEASGITSASGVARALNQRHILTSKGCEWTAKAVQRAKARLEAIPIR